MDSEKMPSLDLIEISEVMGQFTGEPHEVLEKYHRCPICASHLSFNHFTDFSQNTTQEHVKCPECGIRIRKVLHPLQ
ncbi:MAG: hypothetical protein CL678_02550 [Bdellovibrionaceae bacterium]|nr:hypothetical protein [Pseudobdellovibrionaceae bacterium]